MKGEVKVEKISYRLVLLEGVRSLWWSSRVRSMKSWWMTSLIADQMSSSLKRLFPQRHRRIVGGFVVDSSSGICKRY